MNLRRILSLVVSPLVVSIALAGCAANADAEDPAAASESQVVSGTAPITLSNWMAHPKIAAVRAGVTAIDSENLTRHENPGCDGTTTKHTDASGVIRRFGEIGGEGNFDGSIDVYYSANGKPLFIFEQDNHHDEDRSVHKRVYFDASGKVLWQVVREGTIAGVSSAPFRLPTAEESFRPGSEQDPAKWFETTGCGQP